MKECMEEIEKCEIVLERLYKDSGVERVFRPFRFPYGNKGGDNKNALQKYLKEKGFQKVDDTHITYPWWRENSLDTDIDTFWTFDFEEYKIIKYLNVMSGQIVLGTGFFSEFGASLSDLFGVGSNLMA